MPIIQIDTASEVSQTSQSIQNITYILMTHASPKSIKIDRALDPFVVTCTYVCVCVQYKAQSADSRGDQGQHNSELPYRYARIFIAYCCRKQKTELEGCD
jgi:hypothetical protein